jgi:hypothetical protein
MARGPLTFRERDLVRALKGAAAAGIEVAQFEIDKAGKIIVVASKPTIGTCADRDNEWDELNGKHSA